MTQSPQPQLQPPAPAPKKRRTLRTVLIILGVLAVLGLGSCIAGVAVVGKKTNETHTVTYKVTGTSQTAILAYTTDGRTATAQESAAKVPFTKTLEIKGVLVPIFQISARSGIGQSGSVTCSIEVDGKEVKKGTAAGSGQLANCSYTLTP